MIRYAQHEHHTGGGHRRRPARPGGGPRAAEPRLHVDVVHAAGPPDERAARTRRPARSCGRAWRSSASRCMLEGEDHRDPRRREGHRGLAARTAGASTATWSSSPPASGPTSNSRVTSGLTVERAHRRRRPDARRGRRRHLRGRRVRPAPRPGVRPGRAAVGAGQGARRPHHRHRPEPRTTVRGSRRSSRWPASTSPRWACKAPERDDDECSCSPSRRTAIYKTRDHPRRPARRRHPGRRRRKVAFLMQAFDRGCRCPRNALELLFDLGAPAGRGRARPKWPTTRRSATATASARARWCTPCRAAASRSAAVMDTTRAGKGCGSCKPLVRQIVEWAAGGEVEEDPRRTGTSPACRWTSRS